jgi:uncharacterized membrane protein YcaP (DUF421 family)
MHVQQAFDDMFTLGIPWPEKFLRTFAVYAFLLIALRLAGKRELGQLSTSDLIVVLLLSNTVQNAIIGNETSLVGGVVGAGTLILLNKAVAYFIYRSERFRRVIEGDPVPLVIDGQIQKKTLKSQRISLDALVAAARDQNIDGLDGIHQALLETNGSISIIPRSTGAEHRMTEQLNRIEAMLVELQSSRQISEQGGTT